MKRVKQASVIALFFVTAFVLLSFISRHSVIKTFQDTCLVQLFTDENFSGDSITVKGPAEFANLRELPFADKDWTNNVKSLKTNKNATLTVWSYPDFNGDSVVIEVGSSNAAINSFGSMKIQCKE